MINNVNKILKKYDVELKEGVREGVEFISKKDFQRFAKLDKRILDLLIVPTVYDMFHAREEIYGDAYITVKDNRIFVMLMGIYVPLDLKEDSFNHTVGVFERYPECIEKVNIKGRDYLYLWWHK
jgi:hypothetical protein